MRFPSFLLLALALFVYAGCNVFEGLYEEGGSDDPEILLEDANAALQRGDTDKAVKYLEKAYQKDPGNHPVATKLSTALLQQADINVVKMIDLTQELTGESNGAGKSGAFSSAAGKSAGATACNFSGPSTDVIELSANAAYQLIEENDDTLNRVKAILAGVLGSSEFNSLPDAVIKAALLNDAIASVLLVLVDVENKRIETGSTLWQLPNKDVGLCANTEADLLEMQLFVKCEKIPQMRSASAALLTRLGSGSGATDSAGKEAIATLDDSIDKLESLIEVSCS